MVGTTLQYWTRCSAASARNAFGSNQRMSTACCGSVACIEATVTISPYACDSGTGISARSRPSWRDSSKASLATCHRPRWLSMTPLARPVVPPVYMRAARSPGDLVTGPRPVACSSSAVST